ncbi:MAG: sulfite exporter TauE/SafE family protein [Fimbriimonadaceae bacterium]
MLPIIGWIATFAVGFVLGLLGGGGSILIVPVLVYLFLNTAEHATGLSLLVVGLAAGIGLFITGDYKTVQGKTALSFAIPSSIGAFIARKVLVPMTPTVIGPLTKDTFLLVLFAALMLVVSYRMIKPLATSKNRPLDSEKVINMNESITSGEGREPGESSESAQTKRIAKTTALGLTVGIAAGYLGAGGGFLIVPALNQTLGLPMTIAIPTSLAIISAQSLIGFTGAIGSATFNWGFALALTAVAIVGLFTGSRIKSKVNPAKLKPAFGYFVLSTGIFMLVQELILKKS